MYYPSEYLRFFIQFCFTVALIGGAEEQTAGAPLKSSDKALAVNEGKDYGAVDVIARALDDKQIIVKDVRFDHRVAGVAREERIERPGREKSV